VKTVGAFEAKTHLSQLLDEVEGGKTITITRRGVPVAVLGPYPDRPRQDVAAAIAAWLKYRDEHNIRLDGLSIREMIEEGRRY
jgi:prevent-host-death family protein